MYAVLVRPPHISVQRQKQVLVRADTGPSITCWWLGEGGGEAESRDGVPPAAGVVVPSLIFLPLGQGTCCSSGSETACFVQRIADPDGNTQPCFSVF